MKLQSLCTPRESFVEIVHSYASCKLLSTDWNSGSGIREKLLTAGQRCDAAKYPESLVSSEKGLHAGGRLKD